MRAQTFCQIGVTRVVYGVRGHGLRERQELIECQICLSSSSHLEKLIIYYCGNLSKHESWSHVVRCQVGMGANELIRSC